MEHVYVEKLGDHVDQKVIVKGWLYNKRSSGKIRFLLIRDGTGIVQAVMSSDEASPEVFDSYEGLTQESSLIVTGMVREDPRSPGGYELAIADVEVVHIAEDYPITPKSHGVAFLMAHRHLWLRSRRQHAILRIRAEVIRACRDFLDSRDFLLVDTPIFTPSACEGTTTLFEVDYFGEPAYLTQSGQLYNEATAMAMGRVYCFGPSLRAEKSKTRRHLTEFWQVEPEMAYADLGDVLDITEEMVAFVVHRVLERRYEDLIALERDVEPLEKVVPPFPRITYADAVEILRESGANVAWGDDFGAPDETSLSEKFEKPVLIHRYPAHCKPFYMKRDPVDERLALCVDMLAPEGYGEIVGGGQREDELRVLELRIEEHKLPREAYEWYLDLRRYGSVPHAGFGLGIERVLAWICRVPHLRETIPFPRLLEKIYP